ncbi:MAG: acyl-CoA dehydrogenase [Gemmatimonadota bacterium]|nr:MAG: acyl-CoA dehydrogenase [Gemmatimonadota bacterium]
MEFGLTEEQQFIKKTARDFAENELKPESAERDETEEFPAKQVKQMGELGFMGMMIPEEYGGAGMDTVSYVIAVEEISRGDASCGVTMSVNNSLVCHPIFRYGNEEQKKKYLVPLANGTHLGSFSLTEPDAGSDAGNLQTTAVRDGDHYVINGTKIFVTNGGKSDTVVVFAMTDKEQKYKGINAFIVEKKWDGFEVGKKENKLGIRASDTSELVFKDCKVPKENLLGEEGMGFKIALDALDGGRIGIAAQALGIAQAALDESIAYSKQRTQFGKPICEFQAIQWMLADMETEIQGARHLVHQAARAKDSGGRYSKEAAMAKLFASEVAMRTTTKAIQIHGGYGYMKEYPVERLFRDAKITEIYEGTSEVQRMVIAASLLK